jgi:hypothetical protein
MYMPQETCDATQLCGGSDGSTVSIAPARDACTFRFLVSEGRG